MRHYSADLRNSKVNKGWGKIALLLMVFLSVGCVAWAQDSTLLELNTQRIQLNKTNMWVLGGWAAGNIATGFVFRGSATGSTRYFYEMNAFWNLVNLGIAGAGLYGAYSADPNLALWESLQEQQKLEKILLFNMALNLSYMAGGAYLTERSRRGTGNPDRLKGYGQSLILQGGFLLIFDTTQYLLHHSQATPQFKALISQVGFTGNTIAINFAF